MYGMTKTYETNGDGLAGAGQSLLAHSRSAEFTARRGLVVELFPFIFGAAERMSAKAISDFLAKEKGVKLSSVTINKALKDPAKTWNLFFDGIEDSARIFAKDDGIEMRDMLFEQQIFWKPVKNRVVQGIFKAMVADDIAHAASILRTKWYVIDLDIRRKARPYIEHRLNMNK
jgi:hypothetical protein